MAEPWELTPEELKAAVARSRERHRAADCLARPLFLKQLADADGEESDEVLEEDDDPSSAND